MIEKVRSKLDEGGMTVEESNEIAAGWMDIADIDKSGTID